MLMGTVKIYKNYQLQEQPRAADRDPGCLPLHFRPSWNQSLENAPFSTPPTPWRTKDDTAHLAAEARKAGETLKQFTRGRFAKPRHTDSSAKQLSQPIWEGD